MTLRVEIHNLTHSQADYLGLSSVGSFIFISDKNSTSKVFPFSSFVQRLPLSYLGFHSIALPRVPIFISSPFDIDGSAHWLMVTELSPRSYSVDGFDYYLPWTHQFTLYSVVDTTIVESFVTFSESCFLDEENHRFYPLVNETTKGQFEFPQISQVLGFDTPVFSYGTRKLPCLPSDVDLSVRTILVSSITSYMSDFHKDNPDMFFPLELDHLQDFQYHFLKFADSFTSEPLYNMAYDTPINNSVDIYNVISSIWESNESISSLSYHELAAKVDSFSDKSFAQSIPAQNQTSTYNFSLPISDIEPGSPEEIF